MINSASGTYIDVIIIIRAIYNTTDFDFIIVLTTTYFVDFQVLKKWIIIVTWSKWVIYTNYWSVNEIKKKEL